jgi:hypothetical protein
MKKIIYTLFLILSAGMSTAISQSRTGTTAATFLTLGVGAKGSALGHANSVTSRGAEGLFWNPATIALSGPNGNQSSLYLAFNQIFVDVDSYATGIVLPAGSKNKSFGLSLNYVNYGRMLVRTVEEPLGNGATFASSDLAFGISYAQNLTTNFYFGGTVKYIRQQIYDMEASTIAFDFGFVLLTDYLNGMTVGATISNFGGSMQMDGINSQFNVDIDQNSEGNNTQIPSRIYMDKWDIPLSFRFGLSLPVVKKENIQFLLLSDIQQTNDNDLNFDSGTQLSYLSKTVQFHLRAGYRDFLLDKNVTAHFSYGAGLTLRTQSGPSFSVDFAQVPFQYLGNSTMVDFTIHF